MAGADGPVWSLLAGLRTVDGDVGEATCVVAAPLVGGGRLLGSGVIAASVLAAAETVGEQHRPAGMHVAFVRAGVAAALELTIERVHDGRSTAVRAVRVRQGDRTVATATLRFHADPGSGDERADWEQTGSARVVGPDVGRPEDSMVATMPGLDGFEVRAAVEPGRVERPLLHPYWVRATAPIPRRAAIDEAIVGFFTDIGVSASAARPGTRFRDRRSAVTLDHALWWHRRPRADEWLCLAVEPVINHAGRALARGAVLDEAGHLTATFAQEALLQPRSSPRGS